MLYTHVCRVEHEYLSSSMCEIIQLISKFSRTETTNSHQNLIKNSATVFLLLTLHLKPILRNKNYKQLGHSLLCHQDIDV